MSDLAAMLLKLDSFYRQLDFIAERVVALEEERSEDKARIAKLMAEREQDHARIAELEATIPLPVHQQGLTKREAQILILQAKGYSYNEIGTQLNLHRGTVNTYISRIYKKLGVKNGVQAMRFAVQNGLIGIDELWESVKTQQWRDVPRPHRNGNGGG